jgi:hypothetical protein
MATLANIRVAIAVAICLLALGLGAFALASPAAEDDGVFEIELGDGAIALESAALPAGPQVIDVANTGSEEHEVVVVRTRKAPDAIPVGLHGVSPSLAGEVLIGEDHAAAGHTHTPGTVLGLLPHESKRYQVELAPGRYVVICQTDNHYLEGERTAFEVG